MNQDQTPAKPAATPTDKPAIAPVAPAPAQSQIRVDPPVTAPAVKA
jgi:hypothetical protein